MLEFRQGGDSGYNDDDAIQPFSNGEDATQTVFRRPSKNLRARNEVIRKAFNHLEAVALRDRGLTMMCDPDVTATWNGIGTGTFTLSDDLWIVPTCSPVTRVAANNLYAAMRHEPDPGGHAEEYFYIQSLEKAVAGGNNIYFEIYKIGGQSPGSPVVSVEGGDDTSNDPAEGPLAIRVQIADDDSHTFGDVATAINNDGDANVLVDSDHSVWVGTEDAVVFPYQSLAYGLTPADPVNTKSMVGLDGEGHKVTPAQLAAFFAGSDTPHLLESNEDMLVFNYASAEERRSNAGTGGPNLAIIRSDYPDDVDQESIASEHVVPICRVIDDKLYFMNGVVVGTGGPVPLMQAQNPFVIVGPGGHFSTIMGAITALNSTGGTIFIKNGVYTQGLTLSNIDYDITLIGESVDLESTSKGVVVVNAGVNNTITAAAGLGARVTFENIRLENDVAAGRKILSAYNESSLDRARITFRDCVFLHGGTTAVADGVFSHTINLEFFDCYFRGTQEAGPLNITTAFRPYAKTTAGITTLRVERCYFEKFSMIAEIGDAGTEADVGNFIFRDNVIHECGRMTAVDTFTHLIQTIASFYVHFDITGNRWNTGDTNAAAGPFCDVEGEGVVSNNILKRGMGHAATPTIAAYIISAIKGSVLTDGHIAVENNQIAPNRGNGIKADHGVVRGNTIFDFHSGTIDYAIEVGEYCIADGNEIWIKTGATDEVGIATEASCIYAKIINNTIHNLNATCKGIWITSGVSEVTVSNNSLYAADPGLGSGVGIVIEGYNCVVAGNLIEFFYQCIELLVGASNGDNIIANNILVLGTDANAQGIYVQANTDGNAILGNIFRGSGGSSIGLELNGATTQNVAIAGNSFINCNTNITAGGTGCGQRNEADNLYILTHNWW